MRTLLLMLVCASFAGAQTQLVLNKAWASKVQNLAAIEIQMEVDRSLAHPHPAGKCCAQDGDIHFSGRSDDIGLPMVAEMMNAAGQGTALTHLHTAAVAQSSVPVSGVWRLWFEHAGENQVQGSPVPRPTDTNPSHVFEIHPVTRFGADAIESSFSPVPHLLPYDGAEAFPKYEAETVVLQANSDSITISSKEIGYNYTHFVLQLAGNPISTADGGFLALAKIMANDEDPILDTPIRAVFAPGTPPALAIASQTVGSQLHVMGIPRINLNGVLAILAANPSGPVEVKLPYEMVIVSVCSEDLTTCLP